jgi:myo-inositol 2-dehydrogenase/D-chiro-inositol 1-dehydrogenase
VRILHCQHRNAAAPSWFTGAMAVTNSLVHEIDVCRWLLSTEYTAVTVIPCPSEESNDPAMFIFETAAGSLVSVEVFMNADYGYHVHAEAVCAGGTIGMAHPALTRTRRNGAEEGPFPANWVPRFRDAYRIQNQAWVDGIRSDIPAADGSTAWDGPRRHLPCGPDCYGDDDTRAYAAHAARKAALNGGWETRGRTKRCG